MVEVGERFGLRCVRRGLLGQQFRQLGVLRRDCVLPGLHEVLCGILDSLGEALRKLGNRGESLRRVRVGGPGQDTGDPLGVIRQVLPELLGPRNSIVGRRLGPRLLCQEVDRKEREIGLVMREPVDADAQSDQHGSAVSTDHDRLLFDRTV